MCCLTLNFDASTLEYKILVMENTNLFLELSSSKSCLIFHYESLGQMRFVGSYSKRIYKNRKKGTFSQLTAQNPFKLKNISFIYNSGAKHPRHCVSPLQPAEEILKGSAVICENMDSSVIHEHRCEIILQAYCKSR